MNIGIIGAGNMGGAIIKGLCSAGLKTGGIGRVIASDKDKGRLRRLARAWGIGIASSNKELAQESGVIILAVKPQDLDAVLSEIAPFLNADKTVLSIAAGITTRKIEKTLGRNVPVLRAMPNMPALIGRGISAVSAGAFAGQAARRAARNILSCVGEVVEVDEKMMDAVTALSGSGPAYFFYIMEVLIEAGVKKGLGRRAAWRLVVSTAAGAAELLSKTRIEPFTMRQKVASKGGTTEAAFKVLEKAGFSGILQKAYKAAVQRSRQLSRGEKCS